MTGTLGILTAFQAAEKLGVHPKTVSRLIRQGKISGVKVANRWLIEKTTFEAFGKEYVGKKGRPRRRKAQEGA